MAQDHFLPNHGGLSNFLQRLVLGLSEIVQGLFESPSRVTQRFLSFGIALVAFRVDLIASSTEIASREQLGRTCQ